MLSQKTIDTIKDIINIKDIVGEYVQLKKSGTKYVGRCPFHNERTPSFFISESNNFFKCFGCGESGDAISFIEKIENVNFIEALEIIAKKYNIQLDFDTSENETEEETNYKEKKTLELILEATQKNFYKNIQNSKAEIYLKNRHITTDIIKFFNLGFSNGNLYEYLKQENYNTDLAIKLGLIKYNKSETFNNRLTIPIYNTQNTIIGFGARRIEDDKDIPKYINSTENNLYHKNETLYNLNNAKKNIQKEKNVFIVEGYFDVISLFSIGIKNAVASCGTSLTDNQCKLLHKYTTNATIFYDNDTAGKKSTILAIMKLLKYSFTINVILFEKYKDPDEIANNLSQEESLTYIKNSEINIIDFLLNYFNYKHETSINKRNEIIHYITNIINESHDDIYKELLINKLKEVTKINIKQKNKTQNIKIQNSKEIIEEYENTIISTILQYLNEKLQQEFTTIIDNLNNYNFTNDTNNKIFTLLKSYLQTNENTSLNQFVDSITDEDIKKKTINLFMSHEKNISTHWDQYKLNTDSNEKSNKIKYIETVLLKMRLYYIRSLLKKNILLLKNTTNPTEIINTIEDLKLKEKELANTLKITMF